MAKEILPVIFTIARGKREAAMYGVTAVFPTLPSDSYNMTCYAHVGQHSSCSVEWYNGERKAKPAEYAALLNELRGIYDDCELKVYSRITPQHRREREKLWRKTRGF
jgi:hypothetical protein